MLLLDQVASHHTYVFSKSEYQPPAPSQGGKAKARPKAIKLELVQSISKEKEQYFDEKQKKVASNLRQIIEAASNIALAVRLFNEIDVDGSGEVDEGEFALLMQSVGIEMDAERITG